MSAPSKRERMRLRKKKNKAKAQRKRNEQMRQNELILSGARLMQRVVWKDGTVVQLYVVP